MIFKLEKGIYIVFIIMIETMGFLRFLYQNYNH